VIYMYGVIIFVDSSGEVLNRLNFIITICANFHRLVFETRLLCICTF
jgi:hypothetical protein